MTKSCAASVYFCLTAALVGAEAKDAARLDAAASLLNTSHSPSVPMINTSSIDAAIEVVVEVDVDDDSDDDDDTDDIEDEMS